MNASLIKYGRGARWGLLLGLAALWCLQPGFAVTDSSAAPASALSSADEAAKAVPRRVEREGLVIEFVARPAGSKSTEIGRAHV